MKEEKVDFASIVFPHFRGMEHMLEGKSALDALVITPRVCGICGHSHLMATVRALEDAYKNSGYEVQLTEKVKKIRELTLILEIIQNHFKWIYMVVMPQLNKLTKGQTHTTPLKGAYAASLATKALAVLAGQWPHSSYMIPGGVTCDPTYIDLMQLKSHIEKLITFYEEESIGTSLQEFIALESCKDLGNNLSDISNLEKSLITLQMHKKGLAHDNFIVIGEHSFSKKAKLKGTRIAGVDISSVVTENAYTISETSYAKNALYKGSYYEVGPFARLMSQNVKLIKNMHRRYKDSAYTRVMARIYEVGYLLNHTLDLVNSIDITEPSLTTLPNIQNITAHSLGVVEAPRGPLIHQIIINKGIIKKYTIITPTQWNLSSGPKSNLSPAQQAMIGLSKEEAEFIFRTFDVCSVCTTH